MEKGKRPRLWTRDFTTLIVATAFGAIGNVAGGFALSFLVYDETASTLAAALVVALRVIPGFLIPLLLSPLMDRFPRKPFLVGCDAVASVVYLLAGWYLKSHDFQYVYYLLFSLLLSSLGSVDQLSYEALFPKVIPAGAEERGYTVSSMLYPVLMMVMMPVSAFLYKTIGVANILMIQSVFCLATAITESRVRVKEEVRLGTDFSPKQWWGDLCEAAKYFKEEKGLLSMTLYSGTTNGMFSGYEPIWVAFFSSAPGFTVAMYSFFAVAEFVGRTIGGIFIYKKEIPRERKYKHALFVYLTYDTMDTVLLWLPYPLMLINRAFCGFLGIQSGTLRYAAIQKYIPDEMRARINAFQSIIFLVFQAVLSVAVGLLGEWLDYRLVMTLCGAVCIAACLLTIVRHKPQVEAIYMSETKQNTPDE